MFDIGWSELLVIGVVALIVVGPEDLPRMFHTLGRMTAKAKAMAREFTSAMDDAAKESGIKEAADSLGEVRKLTSKKALGLDALDRAASKFEKWDPKLPKATATDRPKADPAQIDTAQTDTAPVAPLEADPAAPEPVAAEPVHSADMQAADPVEVAGRRTLKAVRRSDSKDA